MQHDDAHRAFKDRLYGQFARIGKGLASPHRLEFLELLAQGERTVDSLAKALPLDERHGEVRLALDLASGEDGYDVRVLEFCRRIPGLARGGAQPGLRGLAVPRPSSTAAKGQVPPANLRSETRSSTTWNFMSGIGGSNKDPKQILPSFPIHPCLLSKSRAACKCCERLTP
mgnify:CR=1 FL=1